MTYTEEDVEFALSCAKRACEIGGEILKKYYLRGYEVREKGVSDWVTEADKESERAIRDFLMENFPADFVGEESGEVKVKSFGGKMNFSENRRLRWFVDPLDGTKNFVKGISFFCISVALVDGNDVLVGVVFSPLDNMMFWAVKNGGAYMNERRINVSDISDLRYAILSTGLPFRSRSFIEPQLLTQKEIFLQGAGIRHIGSAALELCYVAGGFLDGLWHMGLSEWDMAAGTIIVSEAGGKVSDFWGGNAWMQSGCVIASNGKIHAQILDIVSKNFKELK